MDVRIMEVKARTALGANRSWSRRVNPPPTIGRGVPPGKDLDAVDPPGTRFQAYHHVVLEERLLAKGAQTPQIPLGDGVLGLHLDGGPLTSKQSRHEQERANALFAVGPDPIAAAKALADARHRLDNGLLLRSDVDSLFDAASAASCLFDLRKCDRVGLGAWLLFLRLSLSCLTLNVPGDRHRNPGCCRGGAHSCDRRAGGRGDAGLRCGGLSGFDRRSR